MKLFKIPDITINDFHIGNQAEWNKLYKMFKTHLYHFASSLIGDEQEAMDIVGEAYVKLWQLRNNFDNLASIKSFLFTTTRNSCFDYLRHLKRKQHHIAQLNYPIYTTQDDFDSFEIKSKLMEDIYTGIEKLPQKCREIFKSYFFENLSTSEIAQKFSINTQTALNQKARAIKILRIDLFDKGHSEILILIILCKTWRYN